MGSVVGVEDVVDVQATGGARVASRGRVGEIVKSSGALKWVHVCLVERKMNDLWTWRRRSRDRGPAANRKHL